MSVAALGHQQRLLEDVSERTLILDLPGAYVARFLHRTFVLRVHTCRHCGEVFPLYPDLRQHLDSHLLPPVGHICTTCKKSFTRRAYLHKHSARCMHQASVCNVCHSSFGRRSDLVTHERTIRCHGPKKSESAPKRRKIVEYLHEDTTTAPAAVPLDDELSLRLQEVIRDNWASIQGKLCKEVQRLRMANDRLQHRVQLQELRHSTQQNATVKLLETIMVILSLSRTCHVLL